MSPGMRVKFLDMNSIWDDGENHLGGVGVLNGFAVNRHRMRSDWGSSISSRRTIRGPIGPKMSRDFP